MTTGNDIMNIARTFIGTPHHYQGRLKGVGVDCAGLIVGVIKEAGISDYDFVHFSRFPKKHLLIREVLKIAKPTKEMQIGNLCVFWMVKSDHPQHLGIITDYGIIHTNEDVGKVVEHRFETKWKKRLVGIYKLKGVI